MTMRPTFNNDTYSIRLKAVCRALLERGIVANQKELLSILYPDSISASTKTTLSLFMNGRIKYKSAGRNDLIDKLERDYKVNPRFITGEENIMFVDEIKDAVSVPLGTLDSIITRLATVETELKYLKKEIEKNNK